MFTDLYDQHHNQLQNIFIAQKNDPSRLSHHSHLPPLLATNTLFLQIFLFPNYVTLVSELFHSVFKVHPCCGICQRFLPCGNPITFHFMGVPQLAYAVLRWWTLRLAAKSRRMCLNAVHHALCTAMKNNGSSLQEGVVTGNAGSSVQWCDEAGEAQSRGIHNVLSSEELRL